MTRRSLAAALFAVLVVAAPVEIDAKDDARRVEARVDPRIELMSIVFRLAGNPEYAMGKVQKYVEAVEARFGGLRDHAVVKHAESLRSRHGVSFDAVMSMAVHLDAGFVLSMPVAKAERLDARWPRDEVQRFADELRDFAAKADAAGFFRSQKGLYELTTRRMQSLLDAQVKLGWFDSFFGARPTANFELTVALVNGPCNYGPSVKREGGREELHSILGVWQSDADGNPTFADDVVPTVIHEFCHSYCNDLVDAHLDELAAPGTALFAHIADQQRRHAYADWKTTMYESLVRACVVRYQAGASGEEAAKKEIAEQHENGFPWTGELSEALAGYERDRERFPTLAAFMPKVVEFFVGYAKRLAEAAAKTPKVVDLVPANGATDVDPASKALVVTFDRPMRDGNWSVVGGGPKYPKVTGKPSYDRERKVLTVPIELEPDHEYELWLNRGMFDSFQSEDGVKLESVHVTFHTRKR